ncbi:D-hexose-6-phosphate mutarotase [Pseudaquabacterium pictum]|uniref:Putative glucose-6-phosphate 1-epimerase n=1 Tax=Pseudaquabacterium pictum TaxID=2315236 RepID=A0A480ARK8_9BURK|nr:D-hexose-6-phosphate mutarotase [Rubrivivax pictus]GCL63566.1 D-hexose-6-phosphate mutarotase [Rubrivivax pictus]
MIKPTTVLGQPAMWLRAPDGAEVTVLLQGGQIVSWIPAGDQERLYLSPQAVAGPGNAVRGGIPVCFPQFSKRGPLGPHGFARQQVWQWVEGAQRGEVVIGVLRLTDNDATRAVWPHAFEAELSFSFSGLQLDVELAVTNTGDAAFDFTAALHTYLLVDDVRRARLGGLFGVRYLDTVNGQSQHQEMDPFSFAGEIDRIYWDAKGPLTLATAAGRTQITREGFDDVVVWNPGPARAAALADLPDDDWLQMLCVEAAQIGQPVTLAPGQEWVARQGFEV